MRKKYAPHDEYVDFEIRPSNSQEPILDPKVLELCKPDSDIKRESLITT